MKGILSFHSAVSSILSSIDLFLLFISSDLESPKIPFPVALPLV